jgi:hypothetical protein
MTQPQAVIQQIVDLAKLPDARCRREIERELRDHLEDLVDEARSQGHDEAIVERMAAIRLGDARQVASAFASVYAVERWFRRTIACGILLLASVATVSVAVGTVQSSVAFWIGTPLPDTLIWLNWEFLGLGAVALGYCAAYLGECMFPTSFAKSVLLSVTLALCASAALLAAVPAHAILPCSAFAGAAFARLLQRVPVPLLWFAGTAGPLTIAEFIFRPLLSGQGPPSWLLWLGLTLSCAALRRIVFLFEKLAIQGLPA